MPDVRGGRATSPSTASRTAGARRPPPRAPPRTRRRRGRGRARGARARAAAAIASRAASFARAARARPRARRPPARPGTFSATSSGSSENQPTSLTTSGLPERERADRAARGLAHRRRAQGHAARRTPPSAPEARLVDVVLADHAVERGRRSSRRRGRSRGATGAHEQQPRVGWRSRTRANASSSCGMRLLGLRLPKQPISGPPRAGRLDGGRRPGGCGMRQTGPS